MFKVIQNLLSYCTRPYFVWKNLDPIFQPVRYKTNNERKFFSLSPAFSRVSGSLLASFCRFVSCVRFSSIDILVFLHRSAIEITLAYLSPSRFTSQHQMLVPRRARNKIHWRFHCPFGPIPVLHILILAFLFRFFFSLISFSKPLWSSFTDNIQD